MIKVKYLGGLGQDIEVNFPGPIIVRFITGQEQLLIKDFAAQLLDCPDYFVEVSDKKKGEDK